MVLFHLAHFFFYPCGTERRLFVKKCRSVNILATKFYGGFYLMQDREWVGLPVFSLVFDFDLWVIL